MRPQGTNSPMLASIKINGCEKVRFAKHAIRDMRNIRYIQLTNINQLELEEFSLFWEGYTANNVMNENLPSVAITITNSNITSIKENSFKGIIKEILFDGVNIEDISQYAFSLSPLTTTRSISFKNTKFNKIQPQAFKGFPVEEMLFEKTQFQEVPSRAFSELTVLNKFVITNSTFNLIRSLAFLIYKPIDFRVVHSQIIKLEGEGFKISTRGTVLFKNNNFNQINYGGFKGISLKLDGVRKLEKLYFENNKFLHLTNEFLNVNESSFEVEVRKSFIVFECECTVIELEFKEKTFDNEIHCKYEKDFVTLKDFKEYNCSVITAYSAVFIAICVILILLVIIGSILLFYFKKIRKSDKYGKKGEEGNKNISLIVPDGKTYKETELHVIVERADLLTTDL